MKTGSGSRLLYGLLMAICLGLSSCSTGRFLDHRDSDTLFATLEEKLCDRPREERGLPEDCGQLYRSSDLQKYLHQVVETLLPEDMRADGENPFYVVVLKDPFLDALSLPDGGVCITTGLLARLENETQLAMVLAHELAHGLQRHVSQCMRASLHEQGPSSFIGKHGQMSANGSAKDFYGAVRDCEREADRVGMSLIRRAGYDPTEALGLLFVLREEAEELLEGKSVRLAEIHSDLQERFQMLSEAMEEDPPASCGALRKSDAYSKVVEDLLLENASLDLKAGRLRSAERSLERYRSLRPDDANAHDVIEELAQRHSPPEGGASAKPPDAQALPPHAATIDIPMGWTRVAGRGPLLITRDGALQQYVLVQETHVDRAFPHTERRLKRGMLPWEAAQVISDEIASDRAVLDFELLENRSDVIDQHEGFRLVFTYRTKEGGPFRTLYYGFLNGEWFYSIRFNAIDPDLFQRDLAVFQKMKGSLRWTYPPCSSETS